MQGRQVPVPAVPIVGDLRNTLRAHEGALRVQCGNRMSIQQERLRLGCNEYEQLAPSLRDCETLSPMYDLCSDGCAQELVGNHDACQIQKQSATVRRASSTKRP